MLPFLRHSADGDRVPDVGEWRGGRVVAARLRRPTLGLTLIRAGSNRPAAAH